MFVVLKGNVVTEKKTGGAFLEKFAILMEKLWLY